MYFGFSAGLRLLDVASFSLALYRNDFARCSVIRSSGFSGNVYGGGVSVYMGGYSSSLKQYSNNSSNYAVATVGDTAVRNASVRVDTASFTSCSAARTGYTSTFMWGGSLYGGSFSLYLGGYAWSYGIGSGSSTSSSGLTTASDVSVSISNVNSSDCSATTTMSISTYGGNSYGGSMSVLYIGAYALSFRQAASGSPSFSSCGTTNVTGLVVSISSSTFIDSSAASRTFHRAPLFSFP